MGLSAHMHKAVMGTVGPMGRRGPAWCKRVTQSARHQLRPGRLPRTLQVIDIACDFEIRPGRPPPPRTHMHVHVCRRRQVRRGGRAYVRATCFLWTF